MDPLPKISVVIATYNRADILPETIRHLTRQDLPASDFEVIVVDDGSRDHTRGVVEEAIPNVRFSMTYLHHENRGPGYSQNRGIRRARAPLVLLMPDDIYATAGLLRAHLAAHEQYPGQDVAILGHVLQSPRLNVSVFHRFWDPFSYRKLPVHKVLPFSMFWACNLSVSRDFMLRHGMFREEKGPAGAAAHEDVELGYRLWKAGLKVIHLEEPLAQHYHPETLETACKRAYQRGLNWEYFFALVPVPELPVRYHIFTRRTARYHFRAMFGGKEEHLFPDQDLGLGRLLRNMVLRPILFNRLTVPCFWKPLLNRAEQSKALAGLLDVRMYQGVVAYYFFRGCRKGRKLPRPAEQE